MKSTCNLVSLVQLLLGAASGCSLLASEPAGQQELGLGVGGEMLVCVSRECHGASPAVARIAQWGQLPVNG